MKRIRTRSNDTFSRKLGFGGQLQRRIIASVLLGLAVVLVGIASLVALAVTQSLQAALTERLAVAHAKEHEVAQEVSDALSSLTRAAVAFQAPEPMQRDQARELRQLLDVLGVFRAIALVNRRGDIVAHVDESRLENRETVSILPPADRLRPILAAGRPAVWGAEGRPALIFAAPGGGSDPGRPWLVAELDPQRLVRHLTAEHSMQGAYEAELLTNEGVVAAGFPRASGVSTHATLVGEFAARREAGIMPHRVPGGAGSHYVAYVPLMSVPGWGVMIEQPRDIVVALPQRLWRWMMGIGIIVLVAGAAVAWFDVRRVVTPLRQLASHAERFGRGDLDTGILIDRDDEIGLLGKTLEEMRVRLRATQAEVRSLSALSERERIARELHDGLAQALGIIYAQARAAEDSIPPGTNGPAAALHEIAGLSAQAYEEVRQSIFGLRTMVARRLGLIPALTEYLHEFSEHTRVSVELSVPETFPRLPLEVEAQLIRIVQEALTNVWRHAKAGHAWVRFAADGESLQVTVEDDGVGFETAVASTGDVRRFGLEAMRERAEGIGGRIEVDSTPGRGTRVIVTLPGGKRG